MDIPIFRWIIKKLKKAIAIVEEGSTASQAISNGKYVLWKGVLCKASSAISQGATLSTASGGNLTVIDEGLANEVAGLSGQIVNVSGWTDITTQCTFAAGFDVSQTAYTSKVIYNAMLKLVVVSAYCVGANIANQTGFLTLPSTLVARYTGLCGITYPYFTDGEQKFIATPRCVENGSIIYSSHTIALPIKNATYQCIIPVK